MPPSVEQSRTFPVRDAVSLVAAAESISGPGWLAERRRSAAELAAELPLPSTELEEWRYSRIAELDLSRYGLLIDPPVVPPPAQSEALLEGLRTSDGAPAGVVVLVDGRVVRCELSEQAAAAGITLGVAGDDGSAGAHTAGEGSDAALGAVVGRPADLFVALNDALATDPVVLDVPRGVVVDGPVVVISHVSTDGAAVFGRLAVRAGEDSQVSVVEAATSARVEALSVPVTELSVGAAARVRYASLQDLGRGVWQLGGFMADVAQDASLDAGVASLGGAYSRLRLDCRLSGRGATGNLSSVYFGDGEQMLDLRTFQEHRAPDTTSNLLFKGAVADRSHSVYTGLIRILPDARGTNAFQTNRNLKLSEGAWAESVPNLEIENNDVRCSHASTVGPVDEDQRFYLESRGVPTAAAERLIVGGFFDEVLDVFAVPALAPEVRRRLDALLDRQLRTGDGDGDRRGRVES